MIDFHCHLLPGLDDGPATINEAVEMAAALRKAGYTTIYCTPHLIKSIYEANNEEVKISLDVLQTRLNNENIDLQLICGREYYLDEFLFDYLINPLPLGETNFILLEIPGNIQLKLIKETCFRIKRSGFTPMIAHPERGNIFVVTGNHTKDRFNFLNSDRKTESMKLLDYLISLDCSFQGNLGSFLGIYGPQAQMTANSLQKMEVYTHFGTDLHSRDGIKYLDKRLEDLGLSIKS
ncbi:MAG: CpsB/CapC family capsule biosynthesis tyrosine phosphatase [Smithella sp.]